MRTAALFVDAGYLYSGGTTLLFGKVQRRKDVRLLDPEQLLRLVADRAAGCCDGDSLRVLRTYWYDGAVDGIPSPDQVAVGELPRVKLRLGRVSGGGQKGVDGLIILDLINLARNRAVDVAVVLSGDEDIREAALFAQGFGVSLMVAGFPRAGGQGQSQLLLREADHVLRLEREDIDPHLVLASAVPGDTSAAPPPGAVPEPVPASTPEAADAEESLRNLCRSVVEDSRFGAAGFLDPSRTRLSYRADRVLVARLAELTGQFPVDADVSAVHARSA